MGRCTANELSGGQRQRLAIARAIVRNTPVLVLDEPTAGLDALAVQRVIEPLRRVAHGKVTILISHDLSLAPMADHILMLDYGRLVEQGRHEDLLRAGGPYVRLHSQHRLEPGPGDPAPKLSSRPLVETATLEVAVPSSVARPSTPTATEHHS